MQVQVRDEVSDVFQYLGIKDINEIIESEAVMLLLSKESRYQSEYNRYKTKYHSEFQEFKKKIEASEQENFEIEDDLMDWEFAFKGCAKANRS